MRYVFVDDEFVNAILLEEGLAEYYPCQSKYIQSLIDAEKKARLLEIGIWS